MKYSCTVEVSLDREACIDLWLDESKLEKWQDGFQHKHWIEGQANETKSMSEILYLQNNRKLELEETIIDNSLPDYIQGEYVHKHMTNTQKIIFEVVAPNKTLVRSEVEYTAFHSFIPKLMAKLFPDIFVKQSQKWLDQFRMLAESLESRNRLNQ